MIMKGGIRKVISHLHHVNDLLEIGVAINNCRSYVKTKVWIQPRRKRQYICKHDFRILNYPPHYYENASFCTYNAIFFYRRTCNSMCNCSTASSTGTQCTTRGTLGVVPAGPGPFPTDSLFCCKSC
jgi:hypothetical protein